MLTEDAIRDMLTSRASLRAMAARWNCHPSAVSMVRLGRTHRTIAPDLPRWEPERNCGQCRHWIAGDDSRCDLGFPDPALEGLSFARDCNCFAVR